MNLYDPVVQQKLQESANLAVQMMDEQTYDFHKVVRILDAQKQIVGGDGYAITFYMGQSQCEVRYRQYARGHVFIHAKLEKVFHYSLFLANEQYILRCSDRRHLSKMHGRYRRQGVGKFWRNNKFKLPRSFGVRSFEYTILVLK